MSVRIITQSASTFQPFSTVNKRIVLKNRTLAPRISSEAYSFCLFICFIYGIYDSKFNLISHCFWIRLLIAVFYSSINFPILTQNFASSRLLSEQNFELIYCLKQTSNPNETELVRVYDLKPEDHLPGQSHSDERVGSFHPIDTNLYRV